MRTMCINCAETWEVDAQQQDWTNEFITQGVAIIGCPMCEENTERVEGSDRLVLEEIAAGCDHPEDFATALEDFGFLVELV